MVVDPAVVAAIAASAATQKQRREGEPITLRDLVFSFAIVFGIAGLLVLLIGAYTQMGMRR
jgi:hypothetical protein